MADEYIKREDVLDAIRERIRRVGMKTPLVLSIGNAVVDVPASDVVEVVRCKDCKHWIAGHISDNDTFYPPKCALVRDERSNDDFCSYGERRVDDADP